VTTRNDRALLRTPRSLLAMALISATVAGCESNASLFGQTSTPQETAIATSATPPKPAQPVSKVAIAPIIGAPDGVAKQLQQDFTGAMEHQRVAIVPAGDASANYTLRGYIVAAKDKANTKVSYIWDVTDTTGKRVNRVTGEELAPAAGGKDPWTAVTPQLTQMIAEKSASSLGQWLPGQSATQAVSNVATPPPAGAGAAPSPPVAAAPAPEPVAQRVASAAPQTPATASIGRDAGVNAMVPSVTGAPGDGSVSLTSAIQRELSKNGVSLADRAAASTYRVEGRVVMGPPADGRQAIAIDWTVKDPKGAKLGTVSQKNDVPAGSLDGAWGSNASEAAEAAAQGILKLLPQPKAQN
jgi:hypothetical protein